MPHLAGRQTARRRPLRPLLRRLRATPRALVLLLVVGALQSLAWAIALPAFQGPDESAHFAYIQYLAETGSIPKVTGGNASHSDEVGTALIELNLAPLIGDLGARPGWSSADLALLHQAERQLPRDGRADGSGPNAIAKNPPLYYALMAIPYRILVWVPIVKRIFLLRLINALCFLATIAGTWLIAGELFGRARWKQTLAAGAVALEPQLAFMSAVINADNLLIATCTWFLLMALRLVRRGPSVPRALWASGFAAAAVLTHGRGLVTLPVLCVAMLAAWVRHRPQARDLARQGAAAAATVAVPLAGYLAFERAAGGGSLYGGQVGVINSGGFNLRQFLSSVWQFYFPRLPSLTPRIGPDYGYRQVFITTFYGTFGSLEIAFSPAVFAVLQVLSALGLVGLYTACVTRARRLWREWPSVVVMLALVVTQLLFLHYVSYRALLETGGADPLIVGRYLLPMVSLFGVAIAFTAGALPRRAGALLGAAILSLGVLLALGGLGLTASRFYG
jgi:hypothetical protein